MSAKVTLIKRSAPACPACNVLKAMLDGEGIEHEVIDITTDPDAIDKYEVTSVPMLVVERENGATIKMYGVQPVEQIMEAMK